MSHASPFRPADLLAWSAAVLFLILSVHREAHAALSSPTDKAVWQSECGSCHVAYPARMLDGKAWTQVLDTLDRHYGVDASLDAGPLDSVRRYLGVPAGASVQSGTRALPRITTSAWFREEHDEVPASGWRSPAVKSAANCAACHAGAEQGNFDEVAVRVPK